MPEVRRDVRPVWPFRLPRRRRPTASCAAGAAACLERLVHVEGDAGVVRVAQPGARAWSSWRGADGPRRGRGGDRAHALRARRRRRPAPLPRPLPPRPADRALGARPAVAARSAAAPSRSRRSRGRSASSSSSSSAPPRSSGGSSPASAGAARRPACATCPRRRRSPAPRPPCCSRFDLSRRPRDRAAPRRARGRAGPRRPARPRPRARLAAAARDPRHRRLDDRDARPSTARAATTCVPAGDLGLLKLVGRIATGNPRARATEDEVRAFFAPYEGWAGLAGAHLLGKGAS